MSIFGESQNNPRLGCAIVETRQPCCKRLLYLRVISSPGVGVRGCTRRFYVQRGRSASPARRDEEYTLVLGVKGVLHGRRRYRRMSLTEAFSTDRIARRKLVGLSGGLVIGERNGCRGGAV